MAIGECGVFANSLKRIGKWRRLAFATGFADFNALANGKCIRQEGASYCKKF
jgi:hypothetical protein